MSNHNSTNSDWKQWLENVNNLPVAAYVVRNDESLQLLGGNDQFYNLFSCTPMQMKQKYANRLGAIVDSSPLSSLPDPADNTLGPFSFLQQIKRDGKEAWIHTELYLYPDKDGSVLCCQSFDITDYEDTTNDYFEYIQAIHLATGKSGVEYFKYNPNLDEATVLSSFSIIQRSMADSVGVIHGFVQKMQEYIDPAFHSTFKNAMHSLRAKTKCFSCELKMNHPDKGNIWVRLTLAMNKNTPLPICILENITQEREAVENYLGETQFYQAILSEKSAFAQVDVSENRISRLGGIWNLYNEIIDKVSYSQLIEEFINKVVHPDDRANYLEIMQQENFIKSLQNGINHLDCDFRRIVDQNKMVWMHLDVYLFNNPISHHTLALLTIMNIDAQKKQEYLLSQETALPAVSESTPIVIDEVQTTNFERYIGEYGDIAYLIDPMTYELICGNKAFYDRLGLSAAQCTGMKCYEAMHNRKSPCPFCSKANWPTDKYYMWRDINTFLEQEFLIKNKLINWKGKEALVAFAIDISNDKSIVDSLNNESMETHALISGIERMAEADSMESAMECALETMGSFFLADSAFFWIYEPSYHSYSCAFSWQKGDTHLTHAAEDYSALTPWIESQNWDQPIMIESPETMLGSSYEMYKGMKSVGITNSRWIRIRQNEQVLGYISINNISSNIQNISFLESFGVFIGNELEKRNLIEAANHSATHDELTGLHSHKHFEKFISDYNSDQVACIGVIVANFNNIKGINNTRGFETGNYYIRQFADILKRIFKDHHLFRISGDEFLVVLPDVGLETLGSHIDELDQRVTEYGAFTVSIGHSWDDVENDLTTLINQATQAMKVNKKRHYDSQPDMVDIERRKMLAELIDSIENHEFEVFLQPKVKLDTGELMGAEALIRYYDKTKGYILPSKFIDVLERNHFIRYIDLFVFEEVCKLLENLKKRGLFLPTISVNFSRLTMMEKDILASMDSIISNYDVSRDQIEIEITESIASMGKGALYKATRSMFDAGYSISLDDFGTKYTNLSILADLNFSTLKADKSLVGALPSKPNHRLVMKNVISMCHDLSMNVIAEGIELQEQQDILRSIGCDLGQGYLYGKPMPISEFVQHYIMTL